MDPSTLAMMGGGAGVGLLKTYLVDKPKEDRDRYQAAVTARYSPWTGMKPGQIQEANPFNNIVQGGMAGLSQGQNMQAADMANQNMQSQTDANNAWTKMQLSGQGQGRKTAGPDYRSMGTADV